MTCGIIPPRQEEILGARGDGYHAECILEMAHGELHVFRTPEGRYIAWQDDPDCGCCEPGEEDPCYSFGEITKDEADNLIAASVG